MVRLGGHCYLASISQYISTTLNLASQVKCLDQLGNSEGGSVLGSLWRCLVIFCHADLRKNDYHGVWGIVLQSGELARRLGWLLHTQGFSAKPHTSPAFFGSTVKDAHMVHARAISWLIFSQL